MGVYDSLSRFMSSNVMKRILLTFRAMNNILISAFVRPWWWRVRVCGIPVLPPASQCFGTFHTLYFHCKLCILAALLAPSLARVRAPHFHFSIVRYECVRAERGRRDLKKYWGAWNRQHQRKARVRLDSSSVHPFLQSISEKTSIVVHSIFDALEGWPGSAS